MQDVFDSKQLKIKTNFADLYAILINWQKRLNLSNGGSVNLDAITPRGNQLREDIADAIQSSNDDVVAGVINYMANSYGM